MADTHNDGSETDFDLTQFYQIFFEEAGENLDQISPTAHREAETAKAHRG